MSSRLLFRSFQIRLAGQDAQRGTFSHRHAVLHDQAVEAQYCIFDSLKDLNLPHTITICNSLLSEYAGKDATGEAARWPVIGLSLFCLLLSVFD